MRRSIKEYISFEALKHLFYIPIIIIKISNWYSFIMNYIGLKDEANTYKFRNGIVIKTDGGVDVSTIAVIFIKKDYGEIKENSIIIDIGANIGVFSILAASKSKNTKVFAFEPMPKSYELFLKNIEINKLKNNIFPFQLAVSSKKEKRKLYVLKEGSPFSNLYANNNEKYVETNCISLKDILNENEIKSCDVLKIDCEGAEFEILYNTPKECFLVIKEIRMEYHNQTKENNNIDILTKFLYANGFTRTRFRKDTPTCGNAWFERK